MQCASGSALRASTAANTACAGHRAVRHLYVGLVLALSGNHRNGALQEGAQDCDFSAQFEEKRCRLLLNLTMPVCDGSVMLHYAWGNPSLEMTCGQPLPDTLVFWSIGELLYCYLHRGVRSLE